MFVVCCLLFVVCCLLFVVAVVAVVAVAAAAAAFLFFATNSSPDEETSGADGLLWVIFANSCWDGTFKWGPNMVLQVATRLHPNIHRKKCNFGEHQRLALPKVSFFGPPDRNFFMKDVIYKACGFGKHQLTYVGAFLNPVTVGK